MAAPKGNSNANKGHRWRDAINAALDNRSRVEQVEALQKVAEALIDKAIEGDLGAIKELGDRIDGKAAQVIAGDSENPVVVEQIRRVIVDPKE